MAARIALITGGAKGIGRAIGLDLAAAGWDVALCYRTSGREAADTASLIQKAGRRTLVGSFVGRFGSARPVSR